VQNKSQANNEVRHADLFYRGSVLSNLLPVEEATKGRVSFNPYPLSNGPSDRVSFLFSITWNTKFPQGPPQDWCLLPQLQVSMIARRNQERRKQSKRKSSKEHKQISLSNHLEHKVPTRTTTRLVSLASITSEYDRKKKSRKKKAIQVQELERTQANLSL
jgi:hypothetical protein